MDRPLAPDIRRRDRVRRIFWLVAPLVIVTGIIAWLPAWIRPSIGHARIRTAIVTQGPIEAVITAGGIVVPEVERVLSSPLDARVLRILKRPGAQLKQGDAVVALDISESVLSLEKIVKEQRIKENQQEQTRLALQQSLADLDGRIQIKTLELQSAEAKGENDRQLFDGGLLSREAVSRSQLAVKQAGIELFALRQERSSVERSTALQFQGLALERAALDREATEAQRLLHLANTKSDRDGVLTWVLAQEGVLVRKGDVIARIADLTSFRVDATISDVHAGRLHAGMPVIVRINELDLDGTIAEVFPTIEGGVVRFTVALRERSHPLLRPSLRVDVLVITDHKANTLRIKRGPFAEGSGAREVFVVQGERAVLTPIELGLFGFDEVEVAEGLRVGDEVIVSDMRDYLHLKEIRIK